MSKSPSEQGFYLHPNGITVCCVGVPPGARGFVNGIEYEAVDNALLRKRIRSGADLSRVCTTLVTNMYALFLGKGRFNTDISSWDTSNVTSMVRTFEMARSFNQPIGVWDTSRVKNMSRMFAAAMSFNQDISGWSTASLTGSGLRETFLWAESFNQDLSRWDVSRITTLESTFEGATSFNQPLHTWDVSKVRSLKKTFRQAHQFNQPLNLWNVRKVTSLQATFEEAFHFNQPLDHWNVKNVKDFGRTFFNATSFNFPLSAWKPNPTAIVEAVFSPDQNPRDNSSEEDRKTYSGELPAAWFGANIFSDEEPEGYEHELSEYSTVGSVDYDSMLGESSILMYTYKGFGYLVDEDQWDQSFVHEDFYTIKQCKKNLDEFIYNSIPDEFFEYNDDESVTFILYNYLKKRGRRKIKIC